MIAKSRLILCYVFPTQWFEHVDCKKSDCTNQKYDYNYFFVLNNEYFRPIDTSKFSLITYNKIHYLSTYFLNKSDLIDTNKYICMVRNENGLNYKMMTLTVNKMNEMRSESSTLKVDDYHLLLIIILSVFVLVLTITLFLIYIKYIRLVKQKKRSIGKEEMMANNLVNNFSKDNFKNQYSVNEFTSKNACHLYVPIEKQFNSKSLKNSQMIHNLVENGRNSNLAGFNYSYHYFNSKDNRSKLSSISNLNVNSAYRTTNTPVQDETFST